MRTKQFHLGEHCFYGTIKVEQKDMHITVKMCDYKTANVREKKKFHFVDKGELLWYLEDNPTPFYAEKIMKHFYN